MVLVTSDKVREITRQAEGCLRASEIVIRKKAKFFDEGKDRFCTWHLCLEQEIATPPKETCAIACGILISIICGGEQAKGEPEVRQGVDLLKKLQEQQGDGGWTSLPRPDEKEDSLVLDTHYALRALLEAGEDKQSEAVQKAGQWLVRAANPKGGWGFLSFDYRQRDDISYVLPTCYAIRALSTIYGPRDIVVRDTIDKALYWLETDCRRSTGAYGPRSEGESKSAVHAAAALMAFIAAGQSPYSLHIKESVEWLLDNIDERDYVEEEGYILPDRDKDGGVVPDRIRRRINHVTFPEGFILQGLVSGGADLLDSRLLQLVSDLADVQKDGCWRCTQRPHDERPIYTVMDGCLGLRAFIAEVNKKKDTLDLSADVRNLASHLEGLREQIKSISEEIGTLKQRTAILSPLAGLIKNIKKYPLYSILVAVTIGYLIAAIKFYGFDTPALNIASGVLAIVLIAIQIYLTYLSKRKVS